MNNKKIILEPHARLRIVVAHVSHVTAEHGAVGWGVRLCRLDPSKYDPRKYDPSKYDPSKYDPSKYDPSKYDPRNACEV